MCKIEINKRKKENEMSEPKVEGQRLWFPNDKDKCEC